MSRGGPKLKQKPVKKKEETAKEEKQRIKREMTGQEFNIGSEDDEDFVHTDGEMFEQLEEQEDGEDLLDFQRDF